MKRVYYMHRSGGRVFNYFGGIGTPFRVSCITGIFMKLMGYKVTRAPAHYTEKQVIIRAALNQGAHPHSYKIAKIKEKGNDNG